MIEFHPEMQERLNNLLKTQVNANANAAGHSF